MTTEAFRRRARDWLAEVAPAQGWLPAERTTPRRQQLTPDAEKRELARARTCQRMLHEAGFAGISWPTRYGGQGLGLQEQIAFNEETAGYDLPVGRFTIGLGMCGPTVLAAGTEEQKNRHLRPLLRGEEIWCQLFSEPEAGSDLAGVRTRAVLDGDHWVVDGQKVWTSGAHLSRFGLLLTRTDVDRPSHQGLTMFILDMSSPGIAIRPLRQMDGGARFNEVFLDGVRVPRANLLGEVGAGWQVARGTLATERVALGAARIFDDAHSPAELAETARRSGRADDPLLRQELADMYIHSKIVSLLGHRITSALKDGTSPGPAGTVAKLASTAMLKRSAALGGRLAGQATTAWSGSDPHGTRWSEPILYVPAKSIAGGTDEILKNIIAERILGLPKG